MVATIDPQGSAGDAKLAAEIRQRWKPVSMEKDLGEACHHAGPCRPYRRPEQRDQRLEGVRRRLPAQYAMRHDEIGTEQPAVSRWADKKNP